MRSKVASPESNASGFPLFVNVPSSETVVVALRERVGDAEAEPLREAPLHRRLQRVERRAAVEIVVGDVAVALIRPEEVGRQRELTGERDTGSLVHRRQPGLDGRDGAGREARRILRGRLERRAVRQRRSGSRGEDCGATAYRHRRCRPLRLCRDRAARRRCSCRRRATSRRDRRRPPPAARGRRRTRARDPAGIR